VGRFWGAITEGARTDFRILRREKPENIGPHPENFFFFLINKKTL
jgi:hypothetical protein